MIEFYVIKEFYDTEENDNAVKECNCWDVLEILFQVI